MAPLGRAAHPGTSTYTTVSVVGPPLLGRWEPRGQWAVAAGDGEALASTDGFVTRSRTMYSKQK